MSTAANTATSDPLDAAIEQFNAEQESTSNSEEQASSSEETQDAPTSEESDESQEGEHRPAEGRSPKFQKLLEKYGGDEEKFAEGVFEQQNSLSRMNSELKELKELILKNQASPEEDDTPIAEHPNLAEFDQELTDLSNDYQSNEARMAQIIQDSAQRNLAIAEAKGELKHADDFDKNRLESLISREEDKKNQLLREWNDLRKSNKTIVKEAREVTRKKQQAENQLQEERSQLTRQREVQAQKSQGYLNEFFTAFEQSIRPYNVPEDDLDYMANAVRREIREYLEVLGRQGAPEQNIPALVKQAVTAYAKRQKLAARAKFSKVSEEKLESGKPPVRSSTPGAAKISKDKLPEGWSSMSNEKKAQAARDRARQILG